MPQVHILRDLKRRTEC